MNPLARYFLFVVLLLAVVGVAVNPDVFHLSALAGDAKVAKRVTGAIPSVAMARTQSMAGVRSTGAIDYRSSGTLTAVGEEGQITIRQLPDEKPVQQIDVGEGFQVLRVRFVPGTGGIAACGQTPEGGGSIRIFDLATGKQTQRIDQPAPVVFMDFDRTGRYLVFTALDSVKVWDLTDNQAVSVVARSSDDATAVFFLDDKYVLQSSPVSLYDWKNRKKVGGLDDIGAADIKKVNGELYAWLASNGIHTLRAPYGKREFVPFDTQAVSAFDLAPDGRWGLFLTRNKTMAVVDCATGLTVQTVTFTRQPDGVTISDDGASAFVLYGAGAVDVFDVGNENVFRQARFYSARWAAKLWADLGDLASRVPWPNKNKSAN
jgi:hypothetical protein